MTIHTAELQRREEVAEHTLAFHFERSDAFSFKAGQAIDVLLPDGSGPGAEDRRHTFSLVSAPFEDDLVIATRMRDSAFKRALGPLAVGSRVQLEGPSGSLSLHNDRTRPAVFIAGGIGITPFMSMLRQAARDERPQSPTLLYSNRRPEDTAFLDELGKLGQRNPRSPPCRTVQLARPGP